MKSSEQREWDAAMRAEAEELPEPCPDCNGTGREYITPEMAGDAGQPDLANSESYCRTCGGSGDER